MMATSRSGREGILAALLAAFLATFSALACLFLMSSGDKGGDGFDEGGFFEGGFFEGGFVEGGEEGRFILEPSARCVWRCRPGCATGRARGEALPLRPSHCFTRLPA